MLALIGVSSQWHYSTFTPITKMGQLTLTYLLGAHITTRDTMSLITSVYASDKSTCPLQSLSACASYWDQLLTCSVNTDWNAIGSKHNVQS